MIGSLKRGLVVVAACLTAAIALPTLARADIVGADCCVCTGCPQGPTCFAVETCDFGGCGIQCTISGCSGSILEGSECPFVPACERMFSVLNTPASGAALHLSLIIVLLTLGAVVLRRHTLPAPARAAVAICLVLATAAGIHALTQIRLNGTWALDLNAEATEPAPSETWQANVSIADDGSLSGTVELSGFDVDVANVQGTFESGAVSGTLRDESGSVIAEFEGIAENDWLNGTLTKVPSGETGTFSWYNQS